MRSEFEKWLDENNMFMEIERKFNQEHNTYEYCAIRWIWESWQHQQSKVDELEHKAKLRESDHKALLVKYQATKKCWEDISKEKEELQTQLSLQRQRVKAFEEELTSSRNYGDELQKLVDAALAVLTEYYTGSYDESPDLVVDIEQALKGEG
ncbi:hypothetical protein [Acinetobacter baumannii]